MNPKTKKLVILIDVIFNELAAWQWEENVQKNKNLEVHVFLDFQDKSNLFPSMNFKEALRATSSPTRSSSTALPNLDSYDSNSPPRKFHSLSYVYQSCEFKLFASEPQLLKMLQRRMCGQKPWMKKLLALREITHGSLWTCLMEEM